METKTGAMQATGAGPTRSWKKQGSIAPSRLWREQGPSDILFWPPEMLENNFCCFKPPSLWCFVTGATGN